MSKKLLQLTIITLFLNLLDIMDGKVTNVTFKDFCYDSSSSYLPNILDLKPPKGKSIFLIDSSCGLDWEGFIAISARQACSVESAARAHSDRKVHVLTTSLGKVDLNNVKRKDSVLSALKTYSNIEFAHVNYKEYFKNSPVSNEQVDALSTSGTSAHKAVEALRLLTLWRFGGVYVDMDVLILKPLTGLATNFFGVLDKSSVGDAVMGFSHQNEGHDYLQKCLARLGPIDEFNESGKTELYTIMRCYSSMCHVKDWLDANVPKRCQHLVLYPADFFYPIHYLEWTHYFDGSKMLEVFERVQRSYAVHFWNKFSGHLPLMLNSSLPYAVLAKKYCPEVTKIVNKYM